MSGQITHVRKAREPQPADFADHADWDWPATSGDRPV
jgi:hypothetical protein